MLQHETIHQLIEHDRDAPDDIIAPLIRDAGDYRVICRTYVALMEDQLAELRDMLFQGTPDARYMLDIATVSCRAHEVLAPLYEEISMAQNSASKAFNDLLRSALEDGEPSEG